MKSQTQTEEQQTQQTHATQGKTLNEARADLRQEIKRALGGVFRWESRKSAPLPYIFNSAKLFNAVFDIVILSPDKKAIIKIKNGEEITLNSESFHSDYYALYSACARSSEKLIYADADKKQITLLEDALRVL
jgi:hypothetical protein